MRYIAAQRVDDLVQSLLGDELAGTRYQSAIDEESNLLFVTAPPEIHTQVESLKELLDIENAQPPSPIRFYKLQNVTAADILDTLRAIDADQGPSRQGRPPTDGRIRGVRDGFYLPGANNPPALPGQPLPPPPPGFDVPGQQPEPNVQPPLGAKPEDSSFLRLPTERVRITADESTNTLIIIGDPVAQRAYAELIDALDKRRAQVLIEAKLVILDASDDFVLGVEASAGDRAGLKRLFAFTSFDLSGVDPVTGALSILPGTGFNGTLVDPDVADVVVRALTNHRRARVLSMPRVLVNDNATGYLTSVQEQPFTSVNASNVVATTSFAGFAEAGTTITVTPHIGEGDHLQLEYKVTLNSFTGQGSEGVPPPRQTNELESQVTIPDANTVIVGGLRLNNGSQEIDSFPFIEHIPFLRRLASLDTRSSQDTMLFVFLKPIILRDDKFKGLKFLSDRDKVQAKVHGDFPVSRPCSS